MSFIGWKPPHDVVKTPARGIRPEILMQSLWAIRDGDEFEITYQSMRRPSPTNRWISPHAIAFDGSRWHLRAWCHENQDFRDFVLARIQQVGDVRKSEITSESDKRWNSFATIVIRPRSGLSAAQRAAVEMDFGMEGGLLHLSVREALVFYFVRHLQLDGPVEGRPHGHPIEWANESDLRHLLTEALHR
jgi:predicted DNA-binding transcriptional regulator YafY